MKNVTPNLADVCLVVEGGYPYTTGGVGSWMDAFIRASHTLRFHVIAISISSQPKIRKYEIPPNVISVTDLILDRPPPGRASRQVKSKDIEHAVALLRDVCCGNPDGKFEALVGLVARQRLGYTALLDSRVAWLAMERVYETTLPSVPLVDFFWSWRFLVRCLLAVATMRLPKAKIYHAVATGYSGLVATYAKQVTGCPSIITEHGIYTNERRIELSVADWLYHSGATGFDVERQTMEMRDLWMTSFVNFSKISYQAADVITTQYLANQDYQRADGAPNGRLRIIPNGIDVDFFGSLERNASQERPTVIMVGRIVPIKDTRTFIVAMSLLRELIPNVLGILIGPEEEDPAYAAGCRALVDQLNLDGTIRFLGRVPDVTEHLKYADVLTLTSISEAQPIALLEAAAAGIPVVTTDVGSCREIVEGLPDEEVSGHGGIVVDACDPHGIAKALAIVLKDPVLRADMGDVMKRRIASRFHKETIRRLYEDLYEEFSSRPDGRGDVGLHDEKVCPSGGYGNQAALLQRLGRWARAHAHL